MHRWLLSLSLALAGCEAAATPAIDGGAPDAAPIADGGRDAGPPPEARAAPRPYTQWVDPFIGTGGIGFNDIGSTYPGPAMPFGMVHAGPDTMGETGAPGFLHCSGYAAGDAWITGLSHTRMNGTGIVDYTAVALMPTDGMSPARTTTLGLRARKGAESERAEPGYYEVALEGGVHVELTTALHTAVHRYTFDASVAAPTVVSRLAHTAASDVTVTEGAITVVPGARELEGSVRFVGGYSGRFDGVTIYFVARFDRDFAAHGVFEGEALRAGETRASGPSGGAWVSFAPGTREARVALAISFLDVARARESLEREAADLDFDRVRAEASAAWEAELGRIEISARYERDFRLFYTALYHALLMPTLATESGGAYRGVDGAEHVADGFTYYTDFSLWDTYRTLHPLIALLDRERAAHFVRSLMAMAEAHGAYPRWPLGTGETGGMLGDPAVIVVADTWLRGARDFDLATAYALAQRSADGDPPSGGRGGVTEYLAHGFVPVEQGGSSTSRTLEYAYADGAMATMARELGLADDAARDDARAASYANTFDAARGFFLGRHRDGSFVEEARVDRWQDYYAEGNAWQYLWLAPQDVEGLVALLGGRATFLARLDEFFTERARERRGLAPPNWYWHGNEPDLHAPFLYSAVDEPDGAARWSTWARREHYREGPRGLPGNDDGGTMSAWYVFAALGFFPLAGEAGYLVGSPLVTHAVLHLPGGDVVIDAPDASERAIYVGALRANDEPIERAHLPESLLASPTTLRFDMVAAPAAR